PFTPPQQVFLEDLTLVIDVSLMLAFTTAIYLLRQKLITVATLAHALSVSLMVFTVGHYFERHLIGDMDGVEDLVRRRRSGRQGAGGRWFAGWSSAALSAAAVLLLVLRFWHCKRGGVDCIVGEYAPVHYQCKVRRLRFFAPVFSTTVVFVYLCIGARLNALLGGSVLHPKGGGYALAVLTSPTLLSTLCISGCASVLLYAILIEEQANGGSVLERSQTREHRVDTPSAPRSRTAKRKNKRKHAPPSDPGWKGPPQPYNLYSSPISLPHSFRYDTRLSSVPSPS
ncbi:unnamed protein product, partial [Ectocarpus sp. 13 AM-2016]